MIAHNFIRDKIIDQGLCVQCGACVELCPYFEYFDGKVMPVDTCLSENGRCFQLCPQIEYAQTLPSKSMPEDIRKEAMGVYKKILIARAKNKSIQKNAQYGGIVSALLVFAFEKGMIKSAVLTTQGDEFAPSGTIAKSKAEILACTGSRYTSSAGLSALNRAIDKDEEKIAVVGLPCQMKSLWKMASMKPSGKSLSQKITLKIGLFCTWAVKYRDLNCYLHKKGIDSPVVKYDIPPPPSEVFRVKTENEWKEFPLDDIRAFIQAGCTFCQDMTAEFSDISVGTVEDREGWNTVIIRSDAGENLINTALEKNVIEADTLGLENLAHLKKASKNKQNRGASALEKKLKKNNEHCDT